MTPCMQMHDFNFVARKNGVRNLQTFMFAPIADCRRRLGGGMFANLVSFITNLFCVGLASAMQIASVRHFCTLFCKTVS